MIWNDAKIKQWASGGGLTPFDDSLVNPASVDLRLGEYIKVPLRYDLREPVNKTTSASGLWSVPMKFDSYTLRPGHCVLCASAEYITMPNDAIGLLASKSSTGRLLLEHFHSGWFDPGFHGTATLELKNDAEWAIELKPGDTWVQLALMQMIAEPDRSYLETGRYNGQVMPEAHR